MNFKISLSVLIFISSLKLVCQNNNEINLTKNPIKTHFDPLVYNGGLQNWGFGQDENGLIYVANDQGVLEYDGSQWMMHKLPMATRTRSVLVDSNNKIFVGGDNQIGFFKSTEQGPQFESFKKELEQQGISVNAISKILNVDGSVYFLSRESKILQFNNGLFKSLEGPGYIQNMFKHHDRLIVQIYNQGLFELKNDDFFAVPKTENMPEITSIVPTGQTGGLIFCRNGSIYSSSSETVIKDFSKVFGEINAVEKLSVGGYVVGTQNRGLFILDSKLEIQQHYTKNRGLTHATVKAIYEDQFKNLWVALNNGIDYLKINLPFRLINDETGVEGTGYCATNFRGKTFLGTNNGVFYLDDNVRNDEFKLLEGSEGQVWGFSKIHNELILNHNKGAFVIDSETVSKFHDIGSWAFVETRNQNVILGGDYQGIQFFKKQDGQWRKTGQVSNLNESSRILRFENDTTLWMTHGYKGAYKIQFDHAMTASQDLKHFGSQNGFPSDILISAYKLNEQLIFTSEHGIFDFVKDSLSFRTNKFLNDQLGTDHISYISQKDNNIYYIQDNQIGRLEEKSFGQYTKETAIFKHVNKLINFDLDNISVLDSKNVLIGAKKGFVHYDPNMTYNVVTDFQTLIKSVRVSHTKDSLQTLRPLKKLKLDNEKEIDINFASPYFENTDDLKYRYRLLPMDDNWSEPTTINHKSYAYLPYGEYRFEVKAINLYGGEGKVASLPFQIVTPWYASNVAKILYVLVLLSIMFLFPYVQQNKFRKEKMTLEKSTKKELEVKDKKIDYLYNENLKNELNLKNNQLTAVTMQLLKNKEFILEVQQKIGAAISKTNSEKELKRLIKTIDLELSDIDYWDQFSYHFEQVHGNYLNKIKEINVKLSPNELKLVAFLRMNMSSKEISKLMNITVRGVEIARYRLRKKFNLDRGENLVNFLISLDKSQNT